MISTAIAEETFLALSPELVQHILFQGLPHVSRYLSYFNLASSHRPGTSLPQELTCDLVQILPYAAAPYIPFGTPFRTAPCVAEMWFSQGPTDS